MEVGVVDGRFLEVLIRRDSKACEAGMAVVLKAAGAGGARADDRGRSEDPLTRPLPLKIFHPPSDISQTHNRQGDRCPIS